MAASWRSFAHASNNLGNDITIAIPAGTANGDLLICNIGTLGSGITPPAGWTEHAASLSATSKLYWKVAASEPANWTWIIGGVTGASVGVVVCVTGQAASSAIDDAKGVNGAAALIIPSVTSAGSGRLLMQICAKLANTTFTPPGTATERWDALSATQNMVTAGGDEIVGSGATGTRTWTPALGSGGASGYMLAIAPGSTTISPGGIDSTATVGTPTVTPGSVTISPGGIASTSAVGTPTVTPGSVTISPSGIASTSAVGTPTITPGAVTVSPGGIDSSAAVGTPTVVPGSITVSPSGIDSTAQVGSPTVVPGTVTIEPPGIDSSAVLGTPTVIAGGFTVSPSGIDSTATVGTPTVTGQLAVAGTVFNHETGDPVGAGVVVKLFNQDDLLIDSTLTAADGSYAFYLNPPVTDTFWTLANYDILGVQYHGVSDSGCAAI